MADAAAKEVVIIGRIETVLPCLGVGLTKKRKQTHHNVKRVGKHLTVRHHGGMHKVHNYP